MDHRMEHFTRQRWLITTEILDNAYTRFLLGHDNESNWYLIRLAFGEHLQSE